MSEHGTFSDGRPITDQDIQDWADEAEAGYDIDFLLQAKPGPFFARPEDTEVISIHIPPALAHALDDRAAASHQTRDQLVTQAITDLLVANA